MDKKFCKFCGNEVGKESVICLSCGRQIEELKSEQSNNHYSTMPFVINNNNNSSSSAAAASSSGSRGYDTFKYIPLHMPFYVTFWGFLIIGFLTGGIYWFIWPFLRISHDKKERLQKEISYNEYLRSRDSKTDVKVDVRN